MASSDGGIGMTHPRGAGTYPRVLGRLVRDRKWLTLEEAIRKMTSLPARRLKLKDRGRIARGYAADLVLFNPETIIDNSTFEEPGKPATGIEYVWVNGEQVWSRGGGHRRPPGPGPPEIKDAEMNKGDRIADFLAQRELALLGMSRNGGKFGNAIFKELTLKEYKVYPVHPRAENIDGQRCWSNVQDLPVKVGGAVVVLPPAQTEKAVRYIAAAGIRRVWMQQGSKSDAAIRFCEENGISVVHGECILMFAEPAAFFHRVHRWIWRVLGKLPRPSAPSE